MSLFLKLKSGTYEHAPMTIDGLDRVIHACRTGRVHSVIPFGKRGNTEVASEMIVYEFEKNDQVIERAFSALWMLLFSSTSTLDK